MPDNRKRIEADTCLTELTIDEKAFILDCMWDDALGAPGESWVYQQIIDKYETCMKIRDRLPHSASNAGA